MSRKLIVSDGRRQRELLIVSKIVVGRDPTCDLSEADPLLSRRHAEFAISGDDVIVRDLGSRNGIYLNGDRVAEGTLQSGDVLRIGHLHMRYLEDSAPLVAMPELVDDATGLMFPGPRPGTPRPPLGSAAVAKPAAASRATPKPASASGALPKPAASDPRPVPAPPDQPDEDVTSYVSASAIRRAPANVPTASSPQIVPPPGPPAEDEAQSTRVVPAPGRTGLLPPSSAAMHTGVVPPPSPPAGAPVVPPPPPVAIRDDELTSYVKPRPRTAVQAAPAPGPQAAVQPGPPPGRQAAGQPPPAPPIEDADEPTSVVLTPRRRTRMEPPPADPAASENARRARAVAMAVEAIVAFLGSASIGRTAADAVKTLERDLATAAPPAELVDALKGLVARVRAAANELT